MVISQYHHYQLTKDNHESHFDGFHFGFRDEPPGAGPPAVGVVLQSNLPSSGLGQGYWGSLSTFTLQSSFNLHSPLYIQSIVII